ncbi:uncharacterized protein C1orf198 homolog [Gigantopelta aegis]|uniref:uncharacterized protein C1orf198 homolog n=1 Tax=Gigantopelta aegis TaxID=1735272 RepID=UPI001B88CAA4|nr:uncharacterized protein C1orf198 homolog [Gigantopelta aegis]
MDRKVTAYFSSLSFPSRKITKEEHALMLYFGNTWDSLTPESKDELTDDWFVDKDSRRKYEEEASETPEYPSSFPKLMIPSGEKIMVDETDLRTWRDAHSGPFSWKSKSQQDLSLDDFEPDVISKPPLKGKRSKGAGDTDNSDQEKMAPREFVPKDNSWTDAMLAEFRNYLDTEVVRSRSASPLEEVNEGFEGSTQDLTSSPCQSQSNAESQASSENISLKDLGESLIQNESSQMSQKSRVSKSPQKVIKSKSFSKNENSDTTQKLIKDEENKRSKQAFCNPTMVTEWSTFVGQESYPKKQVTSNIVSEPPVLTMDRGGDRASQSTDPSPDHTSHLIASDHSTDTSPDHTSHLIASDHSTETSPDHTTQLLPNEKIAEAEKDEILTVVVSSTDPEGDIPRTGFDFLDNW